MDGWARVHGGFSYGARNDEGRIILESTTAHDLETLKHARTAGLSQVRHAHRNIDSLPWITTVFEKLYALVEDIAASDADQMWNTLASVKQSKFKELLSCCEDSQKDRTMAKERYIVAKSESKIVVSYAKDKASKDLYKKLHSKEGPNDINRNDKAW
ncbi:hypothetical protein Tco_0801895 [Tanacetum coccineum]|uniref:Uncharacterized protein n=1 Tax=Tanacetum coccineum TaxID=301880 RepID=A0ABQ5A0V0_9ASTR